MKRMSVYDLETQTDLSALRVFDAGDAGVEKLQPAEALQPIVERLTPLTGAHALSIVLGGNNAVTRPAVHALDATLKRVGLLTLDAHFDLRDTDCGLTNGNPIQALLEDGLPGAHVAQVGLAPFANTKKAHGKAKAAGIHVYTLRQTREFGLAAAVADALEKLTRSAISSMSISTSTSSSAGHAWRAGRAAGRRDAAGFLRRDASHLRAPESAQRRSH